MDTLQLQDCITFNVDNVNKTTLFASSFCVCDIRHFCQFKTATLLCSLLIHTFSMLTDPPLEVNITIVNEVEETVPLERGFGKYIFNASAEPYSRVTCSGVVITWVSSTMGNRKTCKAKGKGNFMMLITDVMKHLFSTNVDVYILVCADVIIDMLSQNKFDILTPTQTHELLTFACTI